MAASSPGIRSQNRRRVVVSMPRKGENIFKRKDGRWEARYIHHYENGHAIYRFLYGHSYAEAKEKKLEELKRLPNETTNRSRCSFQELGDLWLESISISIKESTRARYLRILSVYLYPLIGLTPISSLDAESCTRLTANLLHEGGKNGKPLAPKTVADILYVLKAVNRFGSNNHYYCPNLQSVKCPLSKKKPITVLGEKTRIKLEKYCLESFDTTSLGTLLTLYTGLRIGELCGLRWEDIDFENELLHVERTVERITDLSPMTTHKTKVIIGEPKTQSAVRTIPLQSFLVKYLLERRRGQNCYVVTGSEKGTEPQLFYSRFRHMLKSCGLPPAKFHTLRHTFASRCVEEGFDIKSLSEILGHANISTTLAFYVHPSMQSKRKQMEKLLPDLSQSK